MSNPQIWYADMDNIRKLFDITHENGIKQERERIIKAWDLEMDCDCDNAFLHMRSRIEGKQNEPLASR